MRIIGVVSGKGGVGKTTLISNLGIALANFGRRVVAIDCNITTPHLGFNFGLYYCPLTLNNFLKGETSLKEIIYSHQSGLKIIPSSLVLDELAGVEIEKINLICENLASQNYEFVLLDSAPGIGREAMSVLSNCSEIIYVTIPYIYALADVLRCSRVARKLGVREIGIVLNMVKNSTEELKPQHIEEITGLPIIAKIPFDRNFQLASVAGIPFLNFKPHSLASVQIKRLAASLLGFTYRESFWERIFSKIFGKI